MSCDADRDETAVTMRRRANAVLAIAVALLVVVPLWPLTHAAFLNWDDDAVFLKNAPLTGASTWSWAFTTAYMGHYQPVSWLTWSAVARVFGLVPEAFHALNLATHALATSLVFLLAAELLSVAGVPARRAQAGSLLGALFFGVHPLRVEPVAWASAFPYLAALVFALLSVCFYVASRSLPWHPVQRRPTPKAIVLSVAAIAAYAVSLLFRPIAVGVPFVLLILDWYPLRAALRRTDRDHLAPPEPKSALERCLIRSAGLQACRLGGPEGPHYNEVKTASAEHAAQQRDCA